MITISSSCEELLFKNGEKNKTSFSREKKELDSITNDIARTWYCLDRKYCFKNRINLLFIFNICIFDMCVSKYYVDI